jgi:hypothetical protein
MLSLLTVLPDEALIHILSLCSLSDLEFCLKDHFSSFIDFTDCLTSAVSPYSTPVTRNLSHGHSIVVISLSIISHGHSIVVISLSIISPDCFEGGKI